MSKKQEYIEKVTKEWIEIFTSMKLFNKPYAIGSWWKRKMTTLAEMEEEKDTMTPGTGRIYQCSNKNHNYTPCECYKPLENKVELPEELIGLNDCNYPTFFATVNQIIKYLRSHEK